jgi:hypothetical protein
MVRVHLGPPSRGGLAQLGERLLCTQKVSGSNPLASTTRWVDKPHELWYNRYLQAGDSENPPKV